MDSVLDPLDGKCLNDFPAFSEENPSSERVAEYIAKGVQPALPPNVNLDRVVLYRNEEITARFAWSSRRSTR